MSTCSAFLVDAGALFTEGLYRRVLVTDREDRHYLWVGRVSGFAITMLGVVYAMFLVQSVLYTFLLTETLATFVGISVLGGLVWRRANRWGALASLLGALAANFILYARTGQRLDHWDPNVFLVALGVGVASLVVVSLLTAPEPDAEPCVVLRATADVERRRPSRSTIRCCSSTCCIRAGPPPAAAGVPIATISEASRSAGCSSSRLLPSLAGGWGGNGAPVNLHYNPAHPFGGLT